jgi:hypothetical protein
MAPLINYLCSCGFSVKKYVKAAKDAVAFTICTKCGLEAKKTFGNTSSSHLTVIDSGLMARRLEINPDIMEINDARSATDYSEDE